MYVSFNALNQYILHIINTLLANNWLILATKCQKCCKTEFWGFLGDFMYTNTALICILWIDTFDLIYIINSFATKILIHVIDLEKAHCHKRSFCTLTRPLADIGWCHSQVFELSAWKLTMMSHNVCKGSVESVEWPLVAVYDKMIQYNAFLSVKEVQKLRNLLTL